jgi:SAM-dependent methyltransferase
MDEGGIGFDLLVVRSGSFSSRTETAKGLWSRLYTGPQTDSLSDRHTEAWEFFRSFLTRVGEKEGVLVLNLGAGLGRLSTRADGWKIPVQMVGMDLADFTFAPFKPAAPWFRARGESIPLADGRVDAVVDSFTLAYTDWRLVLKEIHRVLPPGGRAALLIHGADSDIVRSTAFVGENMAALLHALPFFDEMRSAIEAGGSLASLEARASALLQDMFSRAQHGWVTDLIGRSLPQTIYDLAAWNRGEITRAQVVVGLAAREQRLLARVELGRQLLRGARTLPGTEDEWRTVFSRAGFSVKQLRRMKASGADLGWAVELESGGIPSAAQGSGETDTPQRVQRTPEHSSPPSSGLLPGLGSLLELRQRVRYEPRTVGSRIFISMFESDGRFVGQAELKGKRGEILLKVTRLGPSGNGYALGLLAEAARQGLFDGGEGTLAVRGADSPEVLAAATALLDPVLAGTKRIKQKDPKGKKSLSSNSAAEISSPRIDIRGSLSVEARRLLWPELEISKKEPDARADPLLPLVSFQKDSKIVFIVNDDKKVGEIDFFDGGEAILLNDITIRENNRKKGLGSDALFRLAREAALILTPRKNSDGNPVPLEVQDIDNPWTFSFLREHIFEPGTLEVMVLPSKRPHQRRKTLLEAGRGAATENPGRMRMGGDE